MTTRQISVLVSMAAACLLFTSCADSTFPLSDPGKSEPDERLAGVWGKRGESGEVSFAPAGGKFPASVLRVAGSRRKPDGTMEESGSLLFFPTTIGGKNYLNVPSIVGGKDYLDSRYQDKEMKLLEEKGLTPETVSCYIFLRYQVTEDTLTIQQIDGGAKKRAIESGKIKGSLKMDQDRTVFPHFTDTTENLVKFMAEAGDDLFSKEVLLKLERVK